MNKLAPFGTTGINKGILMQFVQESHAFGPIEQWIWKSPEMSMLRIKKITIYPAAQASNGQHDFIILKSIV